MDWLPNYAWYTWIGLAVLAVLLWFLVGLFVWGVQHESMNPDEQGKNYSLVNQPVIMFFWPAILLWVLVFQLYVLPRRLFGPLWWQWPFRWLWHIYHFAEVAGRTLGRVLNFDLKAEGRTGK